ncbi:MAG: cytochrome bc complex cytochrome b subunit [Deltaproteobacteria bacterium]|nr:cytochrome bc complex cytochrome b subunit [Deltaproteobacteria bacterium]
MKWLNKRIPIDPETLKTLGSEPVPYHLKRWWFCLGGTPFYLFVVQVVTGILLSFYYIPNADFAYESVAHISHEVPFGWWIRSIHKWSSNLMIVAVLLHVLRVFFTGAYRAPREINWMIGSVILFTVLGFGFTGYSLIHEQLSYWGATVAGNLLNSVPLVGHHISNFFLGGETISGNTLTRFFIFHIGILPTIMIALLLGHIALVRLLGVTKFTFKRQTVSPYATFPFYPDHVLTELIIGVVLMILLTSFACIFPAELGEKANPLLTPSHIKPEWYFYFTFSWLKLTGLTFAILSLGFFAFLFVLWPFVDAQIRKRLPDSEISVYIGIVGFAILVILTLIEAFGWLH